MPNFTAGTSFTDGVTNDVTAAKLNALVADAVPTSSLALASTSGTISNFTSSTATFLGAITGSTNVINIGSGQIYKDASGNVGVGTTSPSDILHVSKANGVSIFESPGVSSVGLRLRTNTTDRWQIGCPNASADLAIYTGAAATERLRIDASGRVGIGTTSPLKELQINATEPTIRLEENGAGSKRLELSINSAAEAKIFANQSGGQLLLGTVGTERLRIDSSGNLLVGTTTAIGKFTVEASGTNVSEIPLTTNSIAGSGNRFAAGFYHSGTKVGSIEVTASATSYVTSSDYRLKTNLEPIFNGIDRVKQLPVYRFNWIADQSGNRVDGFVAHEAQAIVPECVTGEKDAVDAEGKPIYQGIDQSKIVPLLTAALKEAIAKIEILEAKVTALEAA